MQMPLRSFRSKRLGFFLGYHDVWEAVEKVAAPLLLQGKLSQNEMSWLLRDWLEAPRNFPELPTPVWQYSLFSRHGRQSQPPSERRITSTILPWRRRSHKSVDPA